MKKILFLLLCTVSIYGQTYQNPTFGTITSKTAPTTTSPTHSSVMDANGVIGNSLPYDLPVSISPQPLNYSILDTKLGSHLKGIDNRLGQIVGTTAGTTNRIYFTGDNTTVNSIVYFASSALGKGSTASASPTPLVNGDNTKSYFAKDIISVAQVSATTVPPGTFAGQLSVMVDTDIAQERYTVEVYKTNNLGIPIASGVTGAPTGDLGVTVVAILCSSVLDLSGGANSYISLYGIIASELTIIAGRRIRYIYS